jgi:hypothetical protein
MVDLLAVDASILDMLRCRNLIWLKRNAGQGAGRTPELQSACSASRTTIRMKSERTPMAVQPWMPFQGGHVLNRLLFAVGVSRRLPSLVWSIPGAAT